MKKISFLLITLGIASFVQAQSEIDALRYSLTQRPATARSFGMGSSFGALGADLSSFGTNPGGIGLYKRSGMEFFPGLIRTGQGPPLPPFIRQKNCRYRTIC